MWSSSSSGSSSSSKCRMEIEKLGTDVRSVLEPRRVANGGRNCAREHLSETNYPLHVCPKSAEAQRGPRKAATPACQSARGERRR